MHPSGVFLERNSFISCESIHNKWPVCFLIGHVHVEATSIPITNVRGEQAAMNWLNLKTNQLNSKT